MDSLYFVSMLIGIGWLAWWAAGAPSPLNWSPFDMREVSPDMAPDPTDERLPRRAAPARAGAGRRTPGSARVAEPQPASAKRGPPTSWRDRRKPPGRAR